MSCLMAFDLASRTGWAVRSFDSNAARSGFFDLPASDSVRFFGDRLVAGRSSLSDLLTAHAPDIVVVEQPQTFRSRAAARICYGLYTILVEECARRNIVPAEVNGSTLKRWATGSGRAKKPEMLAAARTRVPYAVKDHNEADAILLACYYAREEMRM